jgi:MFS family permease
MQPPGAGRASRGRVMTAQSKSAAPPLTGGVMLVATLIAIYAVSQFLRNSVGVIAPDLADEIHLSAGEIGLLSSAYFFSFALVQLPLGIALDRFGPKRCLVVCVALTLIGILVFAWARNGASLIAGRILLGLGCSAFLMAPLAIYARRFPPERFATLAGLQLGISAIGTLAATAPLGWSAATIGWRETFLIVAAITLSFGALIVGVVPGDATTADGRRRETVQQSIAGILAVMRTPNVWRVFLVNLTSYSSFALVVGLWGGPYLAHNYGYGLTERGDLLLIGALAQVLGAVAWGPTDRLFGGYKRPVLIGATATAAALAFLAIAGTLPVSGLVVWFAVFGAASGYLPVIIAHGRSLLAPELVGRGLTLFNMGSIGGVFISQAISGVVIQLFPAEGGVYPLNAYRAVFALQAVFLAIACAVYFTTKERARS